MRANNFLMVKMRIFNLFSQCWRERNQPKIALRHHIGYGRVWVLLPNDLNKKDPKDVMIKGYRDTFKIIQKWNQSVVAPWIALVQWHISYMTPEPFGSDPKAGLGWSTWHRINCETGNPAIPNNNGWDYVLYPKKLLEMEMSSRKYHLRIHLKTIQTILFQGTKSASRESKQCYTRRS